VAVSTVISNARAGHRTARIALNGYPGTLALDWANGQTTLISTTALSTTAFDASNDRIVFVTAGPATCCWITVAVTPTASSSAAGSMLVPAAQAPLPVYVPAGMAIGVIGTGGTNSLQSIPALLASDPG
jgi:hypothetical protein